MIDTLRNQLQERLEQLLREGEKLRRALEALDPRRAAPKPAARAAARPRDPSARQRRGRRRTAPGATKARVLAALADGKPMTAGEVAKATGLQRPAVSTTLSRLAKSGEVVKAERGYRLP